MENPFSKIAKAYKDSDFALRGQTKRETKALAREEELTDEALVDKILQDRGFGKFLVDSNPKYQSMNFDKKDFKDIREKYYAYTESKKVATELRTVYSQEIMQDLDIELTPAEQDQVFESMDVALSSRLQKDGRNIEISRLKNKLEEYNKLKERIEQLESKFQQAGVNEAVIEGMSSEKGMDKLRDREEVGKNG